MIFHDELNILKKSFFCTVRNLCPIFSHNSWRKNIHSFRFDKQNTKINFYRFSIINFFLLLCLLFLFAWCARFGAWEGWARRPRHLGSVPESVGQGFASNAEYEIADNYHGRNQSQTDTMHHTRKAWQSVFVNKHEQQCIYHVIMLEKPRQNVHVNNMARPRCDHVPQRKALMLRNL